ncbi:hypothetical protein [Gordonia sihwensis]|uniref:hypothetical protein n=1 Tax=Gordonia sihwensis TaxID=173559 RepID=UPI002416C907|nr:hypothetical protein [Gordonia sihwensis]WFN93868.1 hypothetical protein P5P27_04745 [Gordonia sihwensis]
MTTRVRTPAQWVAWIDGWRARPPRDLSGYRSEAEIDAVATLDALLAAVEEHLVRLGHNGEPGLQRLGGVALEALRDLRPRNPRAFAEHAAHVIGLPMPPKFDHRAYETWHKRQEANQ